MASKKTFIAYSREDSEFVLNLANDLRAAGTDVWLDELIRAGENFKKKIQLAIESVEAVIVVLSPESVASNFVENEYSYALNVDKIVIPIMLKECHIPLELTNINYIDFTGNYEFAFKKLNEALEIKDSPLPPPLPPTDSWIDKIITKLISFFKIVPLKWVISVFLLIVVIVSIILIINNKGSGLIRLTYTEYDEYHPSWSPDGNKIAFVSAQNGNPQIFIMNPDGSGKKPLSNGESSDSEPSWSPDSKRIAFVSQVSMADTIINKIYIINADGSELTCLTNFGDESNPSWSPDINFIACMRLFIDNNNINSKICIRSVYKELHYFFPNKGYYDSYPSWSPTNDTLIAFCSNRYGNYHIYIISVDGQQLNRLKYLMYDTFWGEFKGRELNRLTYSKFDDFDPTWSPDGKRIAFVRRLSDKQPINDEIYIINADGTGQKRLTNNKFADFDPSWLPKSNKIAFVSDRDGNNEIYIMDVD